jgi:acyl-CoA synthetase (AMP-forming)/AMP-acid ligase II
MYSAGKDGDLRDIWRRVTGEIPLERGATSNGSANIMTVYGKEEMTEHKIEAISREIAVIGNHLKEYGAKRVAFYLPNSLEFLAALFAGAFYGFTPVLIPYNQPQATLVELLVSTGADALIAQAGSVPLADVTRGASSLRQIIWTVEKTSRHMDWSEVPEGIGGKIDVSVWHELVQDQKSGVSQLPSTAQKPPGVVFLWQEVAGISSSLMTSLTFAEPGCRCWLAHHFSPRRTTLQCLRCLPPRRRLHPLLQLMSDSRRSLLPLHCHHKLCSRPRRRPRSSNSLHRTHHRRRIRRDRRKTPQHN